jgi:hypothetical protein
VITVYIGHTIIDDLYRHVRDGHGLPLSGEWTLDSLLDTHRTLHSVNGGLQQCIHAPAHTSVWQCDQYVYTDMKT